MNIVIDIETQGLKVNDKINFVGFYTVRKGKELFKAFQLPEDLQPMKKFIRKREEEGVKWCGHNVKFDAVRILYQLGIDITISNDTMILGYLTSTVDELKDHRGKWLGLKYMAPRILGVEDWDVGLSKKTSKSKEDVLPYLFLDCKYVYDLLMHFKNTFPKDKLKTYKLIVHALNAYKYVETNGLPIDIESLTETQIKYFELQTEVDDQLIKYADINYNSSKQLGDLLYEQLGLPVLKHTKAGKYSTAVDVLKELQGRHPIIEHILKKREIEKALSFLSSWRDECVDRDGHAYMHSNFNLHGTVSGRTSSSNVNLQQVPRNKRLKSLFNSTDPEWVMVQFDFSQLELRFAAIVADIWHMKEAYRNNEDLHVKMATIITGKKSEDITKGERTGSKAANFGYLYGMQAPSFKDYAKQTYGVDLTLEEAQLIRDAFFRTYPELEVYYYDVEQSLMNYGYYRSIMQRDYRLNPAALANPYERSNHFRSAINFPIQSSASDYVLCGFLDVMNDETIKNDIKIGATVHDSIITLVRKSKLKETALRVKRIMENSPTARKMITVEIDIPIIVDIEVGAWGQGVSLDEYLKETVQDDVIDAITYTIGGRSAGKATMMKMAQAIMARKE